MSDFTLTLMPSGGRGCGRRVRGGLYGCKGTSPDGTPIWEFLLDPVVPWQGDKFQGVQVAPPELTGSLPDDWLVALDMIGMDYYPTVPAFVEETGRFGLSRRIPETFDWTQVQDKTLMLGVIHWRAWHCWQSPQSPPDLTFKYCKYDMPSILVEHYSDCLYWLWPLAWEFHEYNDLNRVITPWGAFNPLHVLDRSIAYNPEWTPEVLATQVLPQADYGPGLFAAFPITHVEAVGYVPEGCNVEESGLPVAIVEE